MANPLSIAASITGLVTLADVVFDRLTKYRRSVQDAEKEIEDLGKEINVVGGALNSLARLARALESGYFDANLRMHHIESCSDTLNERDKKFKKLQSPSMRQRLKWPFSKDRIKEWLDELSRHKANINLALSANSLDAMLRLLAHENSHAEDIIAEVKETRKIISRIHQDSQQFQHWLSNSESKLWLKGIPGAGKTVLAASIIEAALERGTESTPTAFFFCDYKDTRTQVVENIFGALAYQLAIQKEDAYGLLERYYEELNPGKGLPKQSSRKGLEKLLGKMLEIYDHAYLIVDGLDECSGHKSTDEVVESLVGISEDSDNVSIALLSRDEYEIRELLESDFTPIEIAAHKSDITEYVTAEIEERIRTRRLCIYGSDLKGEIIEELINGAKGM
ncbi:hypothetical protein C8034_v000857 [Colletotrichum sidae]|uniref:NACHT domain-containing protein n=1 Tax=Colletotrichum sidae TaxID=1347389 RepID=A0A4R8TFN6_9PEZI|nr:hypothetical protein C8034_v000857 [Colletotrichum sidae]